MKKIKAAIEAFLNPLMRHRLGYFGIIITSASATLFLFLTFLELLGAFENPYIGLLVFFLLPMVFLGGLILIAVGYYLGKKHPAAPKKPWVIDFSNPQHQIRFAVFIILTIINVMILGLGTYQGVHYMDSVKFCTQVCHITMQPEGTTHQNAAHARVKCVQCHVGSGAGAALHAKINGLRQVVGVIFNSHEKPVPQPVEHLRPAQETCEQCHWPQAFHGERIHTRVEFDTDEKNTPLYHGMILKVGGHQEATGESVGIHWHVSEKNTIRYKSLDKKRTQIGYVELEQNGEKKIYTTPEYDELSEAEQKKLSLRTMDCIDCHNRPTHVFQQPDRAVDRALSKGLIDRNLPYIKKAAVAALEEKYEDGQEAAGIREHLVAYYKENHPADYGKQEKKIAKASEELTRIYQRNIFPKMNVTWNTYINHARHDDDMGCFRCHTDNLRTKDEKVVSSDCETCHVNFAEGEKDRSALSKYIGSYFLKSN